MRIVDIILFALSLHGSLAAVTRRTVPLSRHVVDVDLDKHTAPPSTSSPRSPYKQATRQGILARRAEVERRKHMKGRRQNQAQASATVYPSCASVSGKATIPQTGFADLSPYYIPRTAPYDVTGSWQGVKSALECITLCQQAGTNCTGAYFSPSANTCTQRTQGPPPENIWSSITGGTMAVRGTCQQIAGSVNNATIMANCCDNSPPASTVCANAAYQNVGQFCARAQYSLGGNTLSSSTVQAPSARQGYMNCISACVSASSTAYSQQQANAQCLGAVFDSAPTAAAGPAGPGGGPGGGGPGGGGPGGGGPGGGGPAGGGPGAAPPPNCILQGNNLNAITTTSDTSVVAFLSGRCEEQNASSGTYSTAILAVQGCDTDPQLAYTS